jgi:hypothetical protein
MYVCFCLLDIFMLFARSLVSMYVVDCVEDFSTINV